MNCMLGTKFPGMTWEVRKKKKKEKEGKDKSSRDNNRHRVSEV